MDNPLIDDTLIKTLSPEQARHFRAYPIRFTGKTLTLGIDEAGTTQNIEDELELILGFPIVIEKVDSQKVDIILQKYYSGNRTDNRAQRNFYTGHQDSFIPHLIAEARNMNSSDIHLEVYEDFCRVRIRIDGMLIQRYLLEKSQYPTLINKIKITANLDIAEKRLPQDGRIQFESSNQKLDIRVSVIPTLNGEKVVLRLLNTDTTNVDIHSLGLSTSDLTNYLEGVKRPNGVVLICGPTGSGKTTSLYATLKLLNKESRNILTIEDPIEYTLQGVNQVQLKENIGLTFAAALRTFLRQDPDIIMVGEIRDKETAEMAIRAALTGHLVLSTIHTNSAWGIVARLTDMGIPPFLLAETLNTVVAQRLVRILCPDCKRDAPFDPQSYPPIFTPPLKIENHFVPVGCANCFNTGYKGRKAVFEVIRIDNVLAAEIKSSVQSVSPILKERNIKTLAENAFELFASGQTSVEEIYPILMS